MNIKNFQEIIEFLKNDFEITALRLWLKTMIKAETDSHFNLDKYNEFKVWIVPGKYRKEWEVYILDQEGSDYDTYLIFKDDKYLDEAIKLEKEFRIWSNSTKPDLVLKLWKFLWYPSCCSKEYLIKRQILNMQKNYDTYSSIHNFIKSYKNMDKRLFRFLRIISHIPCSLSCKNSSKYVDNLFKAMWLSKSFLEDLDQFLNLPILYTKEFEVIVFNWDLVWDKISYDWFFAIWENKTILDFANNSSKLELANDKILFKNSDKIIGEVKREDFLLINFDNANFLDINRWYLEKVKKDLFKIEKFKK